MFEGDLAIRGANIITMDPRQPRAEAMVVHKGRIVALGPWEQVADRAGGVRILDLAGRTVLPGLIDTHVHFLWTALSLGSLNLSGARDHVSLQAAVRSVVASSPRGELLFGMGLTEYCLNREEFSPIIDALDAVAPDRPVFLDGVTSHFSAVNSLALELLGLPDDIPGVMQDTSGQPSGLLADQANDLAWERLGESSRLEERATEMIPLAVHKAHSVGITTLHALEGGSTGDDAAAEAFLARLTGLPLRVVFYYQTTDVEKVVALGLPRIGGCICLDGDFGPHTAALSQPYADAPECRGTLYYSQEQIDAFVLRAHEQGLQVAMHAVGDAAVQQALDAYARALCAHPRDDHRHRIEHCEVIREDQIERARQLGVALAIQPPFNLYWPHTGYYSTLGQARAWKADPVSSLVRAGLLVAGGSDSTVTPLGPLIGVHAAVNHSNPGERVSVQEAVELYTIDAARVAFQESDRGSLQVGKLGDLVVLGEDPFAVDPSHVKDIKVEMTVVGGDVVYPPS